MICGKTIFVEAYYDGEMNAADREAFEAHLKGCGECQDELAHLRRISAQFAKASIPLLSQDGLRRLHGAVNVAEERGVLRLAEWLTAAAAAVLVIGITGLFRHDTTHASAPDTWEQAAVAYPADHDPTVQSDVLQFAEWMRTDLSPGQRREQR
jgi:anti-sigma factor RsiW